MHMRRASGRPSQALDTAPKKARVVAPSLGESGADASSANPASWASGIEKHIQEAVLMRQAKKAAVKTKQARRAKAKTKKAVKAKTGKGGRKKLILAAMGKKKSDMPAMDGDMPAMDEDGLPVQIGDGRILTDKPKERFRAFFSKGVKEQSVYFHDKSGRSKEEAWAQAVQLMHEGYKDAFPFF